MKIKCAVDGTEFEAKRATAKYCSSRCRKRAQRAPETPIAPVVSLVPADEDYDAKVIAENFEKVGVTNATMRELEAVGRLDTALGRAAIVAAMKLDLGGLGETGAGLASLIKGHREALAAATQGASDQGDVVDDILESAALKLITGGRAG